jgi:hypothetical protein
MQETEGSGLSWEANRSLTLINAEGAAGPEAGAPSEPGAQSGGRAEPGAKVNTRSRTGTGTRLRAKCCGAAREDDYEDKSRKSGRLPETRFRKQEGRERSGIRIKIRIKIKIRVRIV